MIMKIISREEFGKHFLHPKLIEDARVHEHSSFATSIVLANIFILLFAVSYYVAGAETVGKIVFSSLFFALSSLYVIKKYGSIVAAMNLAMIAAFQAIIVSSWWLGGLNAPGLIWFPAALIITTYYFDGRWAKAWGAIFLVSSIIIFAPHYFGFNNSESILSKEVLNHFRFGAVIGACLLSMFVSWGYRKSKDEAHAISLKREAKISQTLHELELLQNKLEAHLEFNKTMVRVFSHDLANIIQVGTLWTERIEGQDSSKQKILGSFDKMKKTIDSIRNYRSAMDGKKDLVFLDINLMQCLKNVVDMYDEKIKAKKLQISIETFAPQVTIQFDNNLLEVQVLSNIVSNAIKFSPDNSVLKIQVTQENNQVHLMIADQGIGMPQYILNDIFHFGKKTSRPGLKGEAGTGYGMPILKSFLENYGCSIDVISRDISEHPTNSGTEIHIYFPRYQAKTQSFAA